MAAESSRKVESELVRLSRKDLNSAQQQLIQATLEARDLSYSPYSTFPVGAALLLETGKIIKGANQENAAYPSGLCAERTALFFAQCNYPNHKIQALAVAIGSDRQHTPVPCGACLQVMLEAEQRQEKPFDILLVVPGETRFWLAHGVRHFLPFGFSSDNLR